MLRSFPEAASVATRIVRPTSQPVSCGMIEESPASVRTERLRALTITHRTAPLALLERVALPPARALALARELRGRDVEVVVLSTCHRTEVYWSSRTPAHDAQVEAAFRERTAGAWPAAERALARLRGDPVTRHLLRVAAGLDSVLVGEAEVLGQIRGAFEGAQATGVREPALVELFRDALRFGRLVRARTRIGSGALSVASAAVQLLRRTQQDLRRCTVLVVGAGTVGARVVRHLAAERVGRCVLLNRTLARAEATARESGVLAAPLDELPAWLGRANALVVAAQVGAPLVTTEMVRAARPGAAPPLVILDASMPRAVDPEVAELPGTDLSDLSALQALVESHRAEREAEIPRVESLLEETLRSRERRERRRLAWVSGAAARGMAG